MRRATVRTTHAEAEVIARAIRPDNTDEMDTRVEPADDGPDESAASETDVADAADHNDRAAVVTTIERDTTGGLQTSVDDYVVNVDVATRTIEPTAGELQRIKTVSRERSAGSRTITEALARRVAKGELTIEDALDEHRVD
jgi:hypothetical protein